MDNLKEKVLRLIAVRDLITEESFIKSLIDIIGGVTEAEINTIAASLDNEISRSILMEELKKYV